MARIQQADREGLAGKIRRGERLNAGDYEVLLAVIDEALEEEKASLAAVAGKPGPGSVLSTEGRQKPR